MTPKDKAKELFDKYAFVEIPYYSSKFEIKQCALISAEELINAHNSIKDFLFSEIGYLITSPDYWEEVKKEIEKL